VSTLNINKVGDLALVTTCHVELSLSPAQENGASAHQNAETSNPEGTFNRISSFLKVLTTVLQSSVVRSVRQYATLPQDLFLSVFLLVFQFLSCPLLSFPASEHPFSHKTAELFCKKSSSGRAILSFTRFRKCWPFLHSARRFSF
jgi:hypothetical protein